jgi:hypothetical protein
MIREIRIRSIFVALLINLLFVIQGVHGQADTLVIPLDRQYFHKQIENSLIDICALDGKPDNLYETGRDTLLEALLNRLLGTELVQTRRVVEQAIQATNNEKIRLLRGLNELLQNYLRDFYANNYKPLMLANALEAFQQAMQLHLAGLSIAPAIEPLSYESARLIISTIAFADNSGLRETEHAIYLKYCLQYPAKTMSVLNDHPDLSYRDTLMQIASRRAPETVFDYASSNLPVVNLLRSSADSMTRTIVKMAAMTGGQQYFPFLDNIVAGKVSFEEVSNALEDSTRYYSLLVRTAIDYADGVRKKDTAATLYTLKSKLAQKAKEVYVNVINDLHNESDAVRFRKIDRLTPQELYYLAVTTEEDIYTSSFVRGIFPRIWKNMGKENNGGGDSLMMLIKFDYFKKWVKMCANYNKLSEFLTRMNQNSAQMIMKAFVNGLDKTNNLEDAVDVADAFGSITDTQIRSLLLTQIKNNEYQATLSGNLRSIDIYTILEKLFLASADSTIDVSKSLGISNIYHSNNKDLQNKEGRIIIQQYFYGDKDGMGIFNRFYNTYAGHTNWTVTGNSQWIEIKSKTGVPISIYCNRALDEEKNLDAFAQEALCAYLDSAGLHPSVIIHRGHSYYLPYTLDQLFPSAKVIFLGSCGAYQNLDKVLSTCPEAQIISSKQTGSGSVNFPMITHLAEQLRQGKDLDWPLLWGYFGNVFKGNEYFPDYVPPYKNLGALFLMAYNRLQAVDTSKLIVN